jgi:hypothetical protein
MRVLPYVLSAALAVSLSFAALGQVPAGGGSAWEARAAGAGTWDTVLEVSGRYELALFRVSADPRSLESMCRADRESERTALESMERQLEAALATPAARRDPLDLAWLHRSLGQLYAYGGDMVRAAEQLEAAQAIVLRQPATDVALRAARAALAQSLGVAHLRRGELENCVHDHNAERCIFPIRGRGTHSLPSGAQQALAFLHRALEYQPENLEARWLLNVAAMALGRHPEAVPAAHRIDADRFAGGPAPVRFEDVAIPSGIGLNTGAGGAILDDFDGDGRLDAVFSSVGACEPLRLFRNTGAGRFEDVSERAGLLPQTGGLNVSHADFDNDGHLDLFVHRGGWETPMRNSLLRNRGDGTFEDVTERRGLLGGRQHRTHSAAWGDYDNDGWVDLFVGHEETASTLYRNENGTFVDVSSRAGVGRVAFTKGAAWGDIDNDGHLDLYVSNYAGRNFLYRNLGNGRFEEAAEAHGVDKPLMSFTTWFFDYDNDGWLDLFVANFVPSVTEVVRGYLGLPPRAETITLYRNRGANAAAPRFENVTARVGLERVLPAMGANFGDIDNDGYLDMYLGTGAPSYGALVPNVLFHNERGTRFVDVTAATGTGHLQKGHGVAFGDVDGDGDEDLLANMGGFVPGDAYWKALFRNSGSKNHWLKIKAVGARSNRAGIGARIRVLVRDANGASARYRVVTSGGSFGGSPFMQSIGLGEATRVEELEIWWPASDTRQLFRELAGDQTIEVREGDAIVRSASR